MKIPPKVTELLIMFLCFFFSVPHKSLNIQKRDLIHPIKRLISTSIVPLNVSLE